ncbi:beta-amylase 7 [Tanacetum coccineum]
MPILRIDKEHVLRGRTASEVYFDYMRSLRVEFDEFFVDGVILMIEIGLGPCGELRYPSNPVKHGWRYPGVGEFQAFAQVTIRGTENLHTSRLLCSAIETEPPMCKRLLDCQAALPLSDFAINSGDSQIVHMYVANFVAIPPNSCSPSNPVKHGWRYPGVGEFQVSLDMTFSNNSDVQCLKMRLKHRNTRSGPEDQKMEDLIIPGRIKHVSFVIEAIMIAIMAGFHWWYKTAGHAAELTACFYNPSNRDGYAAIMQMLKKHGVALNFKSAQMCISDPHMDSSEAFGDPDGLAWQVTANLESCERKLAAPIGGKMGG